MSRKSGHTDNRNYSLDRVHHTDSTTNTATLIHDYSVHVPLSPSNYTLSINTHFSLSNTKKKQKKTGTPKDRICSCGEDKV